MFEDSIIYSDDIEKEDVADGILMQNFGKGKNMNALHWNLEKDSVIPWHEHPSEQFGYVISGGFKIYMGDEEYTIKKGDAYFVPPNTQHKFIALEETEAIDIFNPIKKEIPQKR